MVMAAPEAELEHEAAGRQHATKASVPAYSDLMATTRLLRLLRPPTPTAQGHNGKRPNGELGGAGPRQAA